MEGPPTGVSAESPLTYCLYSCQSGDFSRALPMFPFVTHQGSGKDASFLGCAIQGTCRKSQLQIPCHMLSPLHRLYRSAIGLSVACLPLAISVVWSAALWLSCGCGTRKKRVYPGIAADPGQHEQCSMPGCPLEASLQRCSHLGLFSSILPL